MSKHIQILDTTLRDGEQSPGICFSADQRLTLAQKLLCDLNVDRVEIGYALSNEEDQRAFKQISKWAEEHGYEDRIEILTFVDNKRSIDWLTDVRCKTLGLLCKSSVEHCQMQLGKTPEEHISDIRKTLDYIFTKNKYINIFLEDWSRGFENNPVYIDQLMNSLKEYPVGRFYLCDTLGVLHPKNTRDFCAKMVEKYAECSFEFHAHNDYGLALSNSLSAIEAGVEGLHATVNGLGERAGNTPLEQILVVLKDFTDFNIKANETALYEISNLVQDYTSKPISPNRPIVGEDVFTHTSGIHVDGQIKGNLYSSQLKPQRFNREYQYDLGKLSGSSNVEFHLQKMGLNLKKSDIEKILTELKRETNQPFEYAEEKLKRLIQKIQ